MSADVWAICPKCKHVKPDYEPEDEYAGSLRIDHEFWNIHPSLDFNFRVSMFCCECGWLKEFTHADL
jgi:hypothetical protein